MVALHFECEQIYNMTTFHPYQQLLTSCGIEVPPIPTLPPLPNGTLPTLPPPTLPDGFSKRSVSQTHHKQKRSFILPDVSINETIFNGLEQFFTGVGGNELASGMY